MEKQQTKSLSGYLALAAAFFLAPVVIRCVLLVNNTITPNLYDLRGLFSDLSVSLLWASLLVLLCRVWRRGWLFLIPLWTFANYGSYEHIRALNAMPSFLDARHLTNATFLGGSVIQFSSVILFLVLLAVSMVIAWFALGRERLKWWPLLAVGVVILAATLVWKPESEALRWRQAHFMADNLQRAVSMSGGPANGGGAVAGTRAGSLLRADLAGEPIIKLGNKRQNVLLIMLESVSGAYLESMAAKHGTTASVTMPRLDAIARRNISYDTFIANQRQTIRGEYALLCGSYPNLVSRETLMSEKILKNETVECLPAALNGAGYETVYLQTAPLGFMLKDQVMGRMGFSKIYGDDWFKEDGYSRTIWGVDDRGFFEQSVDMVRQLQDGEKPWFLTLLTVGTHHPYNVPDSYTSQYEKGSLEHALSYLDHAVAEFVERLEKEGLLEDTLVLITSDESPGIMRGESDFMKILTQNWGFLVAMPPERARMEVSERFMQVDLALSVLDYLGLESRAGGFTGRSVFRKYGKGRQVFFANALMQAVWSVDESGRLFLCDESFSGCNGYAPAGGRLFTSEMSRLGPAAEDETALISSVASAGARAGENRDFTLKMIDAGSVPVQDVDLQMVFGYQWITLPPDSCIDIDIEAGYRGGDGLAEMQSMLMSGGKGSVSPLSYNIESPPMRPGESFALKYSYCTEEKVQGVNCMLNSTKLRGGAMELDIKRASITVSPRGGKRDGGTMLAYLDGAELTQEELRQRAIEIYKAEIRARPDVAENHVRLAVAYFKDGKRAEAMSSFNDALKADPKDASIYTKLAISYAVSGRMDKAVEGFKKALSLSPNDAMIKEYLVDALRASGREDEARRLEER